MSAQWGAGHYQGLAEGIFKGRLEAAAVSSVVLIGSGVSAWRYIVKLNKNHSEEVSDLKAQLKAEKAKNKGKDDGPDSPSLATV